METPRERLYKAALEKSTAETGSAKTEAETIDHRAAVAGVPDEPFPCPACGQLLAPTCRVCVACRKPIDFEAVGRPRLEELPSAIPQPATKAPRERVPYPWRLLIVVMSVGMLIGLACVALWGEEKGPLVVQGLPVLAGVWVFLDALRHRVPRPLRWAIGTVLLLAVILPWYLARRNKPEATVPFVEAEVGPVTRFLLFALLIFFLVSLVFQIVQGPPPKGKPAAEPKLRPASNSSQVELRRPTLLFGRRSSPHTAYEALGTLAETSAPSDARQT